MSKLVFTPERHERGQALVEFALVLPILIVLITSVGELGLIFGKVQSLGYASREGARVGAALAQGAGCMPSNPDQDPQDVDAILIGAAQRILTSPDSGIRLADVDEIRIFKADTSGRETAGTVNRWTHTGPNSGPEIDPGAGVIRIDFSEASAPWPACSRHNGEKIGGVQLPVDSIGITLTYTYDFVTPFPAMLDALSGGALSLTLSETTVMALNPTAG